MANNDSLLRVIVAIVLLVLAVPVLMMAVSIPLMGFVGWGTFMDGHMGAGWAWMVVGLVPLVVLVVLGFGAYRTLTEQNEEHNPAMDELRRAYARGDLTDEEFQTRNEALRSDR